MALSMTRSAVAGPSGTSNMPTTPSRNPTSPVAMEVRTPIANSSLIDNDSPLPSPPSISKPAVSYANHHSMNPNFSALGQMPEEEDREVADKENIMPARTRSTSPTPASGHFKHQGRSSGRSDNSREAGIGTQRSPQAKSLAEAFGAPAPPSLSTSSHPHALEHKLGIRPLASSARVASATARSAHFEDGGKPSSTMSRPQSSLARRPSHEDPSSDGHPPRRLHSALARSREGTADLPTEPRELEMISRKRRSPEGHSAENHSGSGRIQPNLLSPDSSKLATGKEESNGKPTSRRNSGTRSSSPEAGQTGSTGSTEERLFSYSTPALAAGGRSMRSAQTATAGRSTGRTLKRYGLGEARPIHVRPARVMLVQGADDTDGEEDDENVGIGTGGNQAAKETQAGVSESFPNGRSSRQGTPVSQAVSRSPEIPSNQATKAYSPLPLPSPGIREPANDHVSAESGARRRRMLTDRKVSEPRGPAHSSDGGDRLGVGARPQLTHQEPDAVAKVSESRPVASSRDGERLTTHREGGQMERRAPLGAPANRDRQVSRTGGTMPSSTLDSANKSTPPPRQTGLKQAVGEVLNAKIGPPPPMENGRSVSRVSSNPALRSVKQVSPPLSRTESAEDTLPSAVRGLKISSNNAEETRKPADHATPQVHPAEREPVADLEPELEAEKRRLLDLNGWDRYVHAALEEAQRQRQNGCHFAQHPVGKVLTNEKETKFRGAKYMKVSRAGEGGFSTVFQVVGPVAIPTLTGGLEPVPPQLQAHFAMKQVSLRKLEQSSRDELLQEAELLETLAQVDESDKYVLRYFGHKHSGDTLKILMELGEMDFNTLLRTQHPLSRQALSEYWRQMLEAVHFVHNAKLVHSDLKPANFLMVKGRIKLIDFGIAQKIPLGTVHISRDVIVGTPNYMAPEAIQKARRGGHGVYKAGKPSDVWSLGCILYQMIYGRTPFAHVSGDKKLEVITNAKHTIAFPSKRVLDDTPQRSADGEGASGDGEGEKEEAEEVDEILINCVQSALVYDSQLRAKIPQLLEHLFVRDEVTLSRKKLKSIVFRIQAYMQQGRLTEDNVDEIADRLVTNLQLDGFQPFDPERD